MTREEAKELLPIIKAYAEGKTIQVWANDTWQDEESPLFWAYAQFRIKPEQKSEPKYRPFETKEECWNEMHKHPDFGWVKRVQEPAYLSLNKIEEIGRVEGWNFEDIFDKITFTDGEPFGIKEE